MRQKIINLIKTNSLIYEIFYRVVSLLIKFLGIFIKTNDNLFLFVSFGGKKYDDSPKAIFEYLCIHHKSDEVKYIWAFVEPDKYYLPDASKVKIDTLRYIIIALKAKYWITNSAVERGLSFKPKKTILLNTWHGTPIKRICEDGNNVKSKFGFGSKKGSEIDLMTAQSNYDAAIFQKIFNVNKENIVICDLPRNDSMYHYTKEDCLLIKTKLGIKDLNKKVILYAPTYREYSIDSDSNCTLNIPIDFSNWEKIIGDEYIVLLRAHYEVAMLLNVSVDGDFVVNVSDYSALNDLMIIADLLISDYSSIFFDYSILERPMLCYSYDIDEYEEKRGIYLDINELFQNSLLRTESELLVRIKNLDYKRECALTANIKNKYVPYSGRSTQIIVDTMLKKK